MQTSEILAAIDEEISRLQQARNLLAGNSTGRMKRGPEAAAATAPAFPFGLGTTTAPKKRSKISAAGRARIAAAQRARWAKLKKATGEKEKNGKK